MADLRKISTSWASTTRVLGENVLVLRVGDRDLCLGEVGDDGYSGDKRSDDDDGGERIGIESEIWLAGLVFRGFAIGSCNKNGNCAESTSLFEISCCLKIFDGVGGEWRFPLLWLFIFKDSESLLLELTDWLNYEKGLKSLTNGLEILSNNGFQYDDLMQFGGLSTV